MDSPALWALVALLVSNRWLLGVALCSWEVSTAALVAAGAVVWAAFPVLAELGATPLTKGLNSASTLVCVIICCESVVLALGRPYHRLLSVSGIAGMLYLLALLFQGGWLSAAFGLQAGLFFLALLSGAAVYRALAVRWDLKRLDGYLYLPAIWLCCWLSQARWPREIELGGVIHLRDTAWLMLLLPLIAGVALFAQWVLHCIFRSQRTLL